MLAVIALNGALPLPAKFGLAPEGRREAGAPTDVFAKTAEDSFGADCVIHILVGISANRIEGIDIFVSCVFAAEAVHRGVSGGLALLSF